MRPLNQIIYKLLILCLFWCVYFYPMYAVIIADFKILSIDNKT